MKDRQIWMAEREAGALINAPFCLDIVSYFQDSEIASISSKKSLKKIAEELNFLFHICLHMMRFWDNFSSLSAI